MTASVQLQVSPVRSRLFDLLDAELGYRPDAKGGYVNHLAMTLVAAARLGASDARLDEVFERQTSDDFLRSRLRPAWLASRAEEVARRGIVPLATESLPKLTAAVHARWFHAIIRLEHAVDAQHPGQVAGALFDWEQAGEPLPELPAARGDSSLVDVVRRLGESGGHEPFRKARDLGEVAATPEFGALLGQARLGPDALRDATELALLSHIDAANFTTLHLVTGSCAAGALAEYLPEPTALDLGERLAQAVLAGYLLGGKRLPAPSALEALRGRDLPSWAAIREKATASNDAHVPKITYACLRQERRTGDRAYRWVAARDCGLLET